MNRHLLLWLIAVALLATVSCRPRHPPHTPQPFGMKTTTGGPVLVTGLDDLQTVVSALR